MDPKSRAPQPAPKGRVRVIILKSVGIAAMLTRLGWFGTAIAFRYF